MSNTLSDHAWLGTKNNNLLTKIEEKLKEFELEESVFKDWMSNFKGNDESELALKIFFLIDYYPHQKVIGRIKDYLIQVQQSMHGFKNNIILIVSDEITDSGMRFLYDISKQWEMLDGNGFRKSDLTNEIKNNKDNFFVFFNDTHGTGKQLIREFKDIIQDLGEENCAIISLNITKKAVDNIKAKLLNIALVYPDFQSTKNIIEHQNASALTSDDISLLEKLGEKVYSKGALGYKNSGLLLAYSHQCPNNTLPIIWANGTNNEIKNSGYPWKHLFEYKKIKPQKTINKEERNTNYLTTLPPRNRDFIGRKEELKQIKESLQSSNIIYIVNGIGGVGKSELSYEYFHSAKDDYNKIAFIELDANVSLEDTFIIKFKDKFQVDTFDKIIKRLQEYKGKNLFLIDNLEKREDFDKLKKLNFNFDLLITTRLQDIDTTNQLNLEILNDEDAKELFLGIYDENEDIEDILTYLDNHPLFINLTAKSLKQRYITIEDLRKDIKDNNISKIDSKDDKTFKKHLKNRFNAQFENEKNRDLKLLLQKLSIFPSIEIELEVFKKLLKIEQSELQKLVHRGWLSEKDNQYKLHQIIKIFLYEEHKIEYENVKHIFQEVIDYINPDDSIIIASNLNHYIPIVESFIKLFEAKEDEYIAGMLDSLTYLHYSLAKYDMALDVQNKSLNIRKAVDSENDKDIARSYDLLGIIYESQNKFKEAEKLYKKSMKIREDVLGENHLDTANSYNNLALLHKRQNKFKEAEELYKKSMKIREDVLGENHPDTATSYNNLASLYESQNKLKEAEELYKKSMKIREDVLGENHPDTATSYNNLSSLYESQNKLKEAEELYKKSMKIYEDVLGENHTYTANSYSNLGLLYEKQKYCDKAELYLIKAQKIYAQYEHTKSHLYNIGKVLKDIKINKKKALKFKNKKDKYCKDYPVKV